MVPGYQPGPRYIRVSAPTSTNSISYYKLGTRYKLVKSLNRELSCGGQPLYTQSRHLPANPIVLLRLDPICWTSICGCKANTAFEDSAIFTQLYKLCVGSAPTYPYLQHIYLHHIIYLHYIHPHHIYLHYIHPQLIYLQHTYP